jgi:prevent-host-death family protein
LLPQVTPMRTYTLSSRDFNQDTSKAKKAARLGPVVITDRGQPAHVLMTYAHYQRLTGERHNIADLLAMPGAADIPFDPSPSKDIARTAELG